LGAAETPAPAASTPNLAAPVPVKPAAPTVAAKPITADSLPIHVTLDNPRGVAVDASGKVYVSDFSGAVIYQVSLTPPLSAVAIPAPGTQPPPPNSAFSGPCEMAVDAQGNLYVADADNHVIRKILASKSGPPTEMIVLAGNVGVSGTEDGTGPAARFGTPTAVAVDAVGNVYVADNQNATIRRITPAGVVTTLAGKAGATGNVDGTGADARFNTPRGIAVDKAGNIFVADEGNSNIRKITPAGVVTTFAGSAAETAFKDGPAKDATFGAPRGLCVDASGNVFVADTNNNLVRKITPDGTVSTFAGQISGGMSDGTGTAARFSGLRAIAADASGNLYVADSDNGAVRKITPTGVVTTVIAGTQ
jgi:sugar lactone lactonase YvrE